MRIAMLATASAIAFVFAIGSVSAADQFTTLKGVKAVPMSAGEMSAVKGMDHHFFVLVDADHPNGIQVMVNNQLTWVLEPPGGADGTGRFNTDQHQDAIADPAPGANFKLIEFPTQTSLRSPAYSGLRNACGNGKIEGPNFLC
jgi:hypothetical protein